MRILSAIMTLLFIACIAVQYNDPDPLIWMLLYAVPLGLTLLSLGGRHLVWLAALGALAYGAAGLCWAPPYAPGYLDNEEAREAGGLLLSGLWMTVLVARATLPGRRRAWR